MEEPKSLSKYLDKKRESEKEAELERLEANKPEIIPPVGSIVRFYYGDPMLLNAPVVELPAVVTSCDKWGRINGWGWVDPGMTAMGPDGKPVRVPPMIPIGQSSYHPDGEKLTWRWLEVNGEAS